MPTNIEIKARIASVDAMRPIAAAIADQGPVEIAQDDTFFRCGSGRLKLRVFSPERGELIHYHRPDRQGPKASSYLRCPTSEPDTLRACLAGAYGEDGRVVKHRTLFLAGRTRIHLDRVEALGDFLELEVVLDEGEGSEAGVAEANALMVRLGIDASQLVESAYVDLLRARR